MNNNGKRKTLGELFLLMHSTKNPVTRCSYRQAIANRLDRIEKMYFREKIIFLEEFNTIGKI